MKTNTNMSSTVRVCAIQGGPCGQNHTLNIEQQLGYLKNAMDASPDIVCFSEYTTIPAFCYVQNIENYFTYAEPIPGPTSKAFAEAAKEYGIYLIANIFEDRGNGVYYNTSPLFGPDGEIVWGRMLNGTLLRSYQKLHIPAGINPDHSPRPNEKMYFHPGAGPATFETPFGRIAIMICYDKRFTELWRIYGLRGVEIVFNPMAAGSAVAGNGIFQKEMQVMAFYNQLYTVGVAKAGCETIFGNLEMSGGSAIADPAGKILAQADSEPGHTIVADLDLDKVKRARIHTPIYRDRRPELYKEISDVI